MKPNPGILGLLLGTLCLSPSFAGQSPSPVLQPSRVVEGRELTSLADPPIRIRVRPGFRYVGGQRFILRDVADVEQHLFVETGTHNAVTRAFWIQFERLLPGRSGSYTYDSDEPIDVMGVSMRASVRRFTEPPAPDSDRWRAYNLVARAGLVIPIPATRVRLVHVPDADARQELMNRLHRTGSRRIGCDERRAPGHRSTRHAGTVDHTMTHCSDGCEGEVVA